MNKIINIIFAAVVLVSFKACDYLEAEEYLNEVKHVNEIWQDKADVMKAYAACYGSIPQVHDGLTNWAFTTISDECHGGRDEYQSMKIAQGKLNADNIPSGSNHWAKFYRTIRVCNQFLENAQRSTDKLFYEGEIDEMKNDVRFLRAFYYSLMLEIYGPFVIVDKVVDYTSSDLPTERKSIDECVKFIIDELDAVVEKMPLKADLTVEKSGRPTKATVMACKARTLLVAASPLFNGNVDYSTFVNESGGNLIPQSYDAEKWKKAADAYKAIIDLGTYKLYTVASEDNEKYKTVALGTFDGNDKAFPEGPAGIDPYKSYKNLFNDREDFWNDEAIWKINTGSSFLAINGWVRGHKYSPGHLNHYSATQKIVDMYHMIDGTLPETSALYEDNGIADASDNNFILGVTDATTARLSPIKTNYLAGNQFRPVPKRVLNREPRFYASVGFIGRGYLQDQNPPYYFCDLRYGSVDGYIETDRPSCRTGYLITKWVADDELTPAGNASKSMYMYRMADVYLAYAEALNEYDPGNADILKYLNMVRYRAGLNGYTTGNQDEIREYIKRERSVELAFEGKRYFDLKRWKDAAKSQLNAMGNTIGINGAVKGCDFLKSDINFYNRTIIDGYLFKKKDYLFPISYQQVESFWGKTIQNPGW